MAPSRVLARLAALLALTAACGGRHRTHTTAVGDAAAGAGGAPECSRFDNVASDATLPIEIVNGTDQYVYVGHPCGSTALYQVEPPP